jgi:hypothetical protein
MKLVVHALLVLTLAWLTTCQTVEAKLPANRSFGAPKTNEPVVVPPEMLPVPEGEEPTNQIALTNAVPVNSMALTNGTPTNTVTAEITRTNTSITTSPPGPIHPWLGLQLFIQTDSAVRALAAALPSLTNIGVNAIIVETGYAFEFKSHPELIRGRGVSRAAAKYLAAVARTNGVRLIPELDCLGHQSLRNSTLPLLATYPEFKEPSPKHPDPKTDYLKSWCPNDPRVEPIVFDLIDEIGEAFDADAFHVGMDEIFNLASDNCPRCRGADPADLLAKVVNDLHAHIVQTNKWEMFMWGDRLLDGHSLGYSKWEGSQIGTDRAIDLIPKDIVVCDWHYGQRATYPSVPLLLNKGFRVWPAGFRPLEACQTLSNYSLKMRAKNQRLVGYLATTWSVGKPETVAAWPPVKDILKDWRPVVIAPTNAIATVLTNDVISTTTNTISDAVTNMAPEVMTNSVPVITTNTVPDTATNPATALPPN